jgi:hypothetical protein
LVTSLSRIQHHLMSRSASSPRDDEELAVHSFSPKVEAGRRFLVYF